MSRAEVKQELPGQLLLMRRPALGERLHRGLDPLQTPNVDDRSSNPATLSTGELARRRAP
jgi:hypothetical protein